MRADTGTDAAIGGTNRERKRKIPRFHERMKISWEFLLDFNLSSLLFSWIMTLLMFITVTVNYLHIWSNSVVVDF